MGMFDDRYQDNDRSNTKGYLDWQALGGNVKFYKPPKDGEGAIDIVPFKIGSSNHPRVRLGKAKVGDYEYALDLEVHRRVGPTEEDIVCLKQYGQRCPLCDHAEELKKEYGYKDERYINMKAKRRIVYNVLDATSEKLELKIFEVSHWFFEKELWEKAKRVGAKKGLPFIDYADPKTGYTVAFATTTESSGGFETTKFKDFEFEKREAGLITPELMEKAYQLDKGIKLRSAEEIEKLLYGVGEDADEGKEDDEPAPARRRVSEESSDDEAAPGRRRTAEVEEEAPARRRAAAEPNPEDAAPAVEEEAPRRRTAAPAESSQESATKPGCPYGHRYGVDSDEKRECEDCAVWAECMKELRRTRKGA